MCNIQMSIRCVEVALVVGLLATSVPTLSEPTAAVKQASAPKIGQLDADLQKQKLDAEIAKLKVETTKLKAEADSLAPWYGSQVAALLGLVGILGTGWLGWRSAIKARIGSFEAKLHEQRLQAYGSMVAATEALAMHFPQRRVDQDACACAGNLLRAQFFGLTGMLLTEHTRKRYMTLMLHVYRAKTLGLGR